MHAGPRRGGRWIDAERRAGGEVKGVASLEGLTVSERSRR